MAKVVVANEVEAVFATPPRGSETAGRRSGPPACSLRRYPALAQARDRPISAVFAGSRPEEKKMGEVVSITMGFPPVKYPRSRESRGRVGLAKVGWEAEQGKNYKGNDREV